MNQRGTLKIENATYRIFSVRVCMRYIYAFSAAIYLLVDFHYGRMFVFSLQKIYSDFELQGVIEDKLNSKTYQTVFQRVQTEEATCSLTMPGGEE